MRIIRTIVPDHRGLQDKILKSFVVKVHNIAFPLVKLVDKSNDSKALLFFQKVKIVVFQHFPSLAHMYFILSCSFSLFDRILVKQVPPHFFIPFYDRLCVFSISIFFFLLKVYQSNMRNQLLVLLLSCWLDSRSDIYSLQMSVLYIVLDGHHRLNKTLFLLNSLKFLQFLLLFSPLSFSFKLYSFEFVSSIFYFLQVFEGKSRWLEL